MRRAATGLTLVALALTLGWPPATASAGSDVKLKRVTLVKKEGQPPLLRFASRPEVPGRDPVSVLGPPRPHGADPLEAPKTDSRHWVLRPSGRENRVFLRKLRARVRGDGRAIVAAAVVNRNGPVPLSFFTIRAVNRPARN